MFTKSGFSFSLKVLKITGSFFFFICLMFLLFPISCSNQNKEKREKKEITLDSLVYDKNGNLFTGRMKRKVNNKYIEYDVVNGKKNGEFRLFHENDALEIEGQIENNKNTGLWKYYYNNGQLESEGNFTNDLVDGKWVWYYPSGKIKEEGEFKEGIRDGFSTTYDENGKVIDEKKFEKGKEVGK